MNTSFIAYGIDVVSDPSLGTLSGAGNDAAGQISLLGGTQIFGDTQVVEFIVENVDTNGELSGTSQIVGIVVYDSIDDYNTGTALYTYEPMNTGQFAQIQDDLSGIGDTYLRFNANVLVSSDPGAPSLTSLFVAPGSDATDNIGSLTIDRDTDVDYSGDGVIQADTVEEGNTYFNINYADLAYSAAPDGVVTGADTGEVMGLGYVDSADGDMITTGDDQIEGLLGNDTIDGDAGNDGVVGGGGDDLITGGAGNDWVLGEAGDDTITLADGWGADTVIGGATEEIKGDTLDASAVTAGLSVDLSGTDAEAGTLTDGTNSAVFSEIETIVLGSGIDTLILGDGGGARVVDGFAGPVDNSDGTYSGLDQLDVSGLTNGTGDPVTVDDVTVGADTDGNAVLTFPGGETLTLIGVAAADVTAPAALEAMGIPVVATGGPDPVPVDDYIVSGDVTDDYIDEWYTGDPDGDMIDANDAADGSNDDHVQAGDGNDTVLSGLGNDSIEGGLGDDRLEGGVGSDTILGQEGNDKIWGGDDDDTILGGDGADTIEGNYGADYIEGGAGNDSILGDTGDDTIIGGEGDDWLRGSVGYDVMSGGTGDDYIWSGYQDDTITLEDNFGNDTIEMEDIDETTGDVLDASAVTSNLVVDLRAASAGVGTLSDGTSTASFVGVEHLILGSGVHTILLAQTSGVDVIQGFTAPTDNGDGTFTGTDVLDLTNMVNDDGDPVDTDDVTVIDDGSGNALLSFAAGESLTLVGISPSQLTDPAALNAIGIPLPPVVSDGIVSGTGGDDVIDIAYTGDPEGDMVDGADGDNDVIVAGDGNDTIDGGAGSDTIQGGAGADSIILGAGDDASGESGDDVFTVSAQGGGIMTVDGGETGETLGDRLDITGPATINIDPADSEAGTVIWADGTKLSFSNIEKINYVPCFTPSTLIKTRRGEIPAAALRPEDRILTRDNGFQPISWIGTRTLSGADLAELPSLNPVLIRKGALGNNQPDRDLLVSPQHRMLLTSQEASLWFGEAEVFVPAIALTFLPGVRQLDSTGITYVHFMFEQHQVVLGDGAWSESFQPGDMTLAGMDTQQRQELLSLFPQLQQENTNMTYPAARVTLSTREARLLAL